MPPHPSGFYYPDDVHDMLGMYLPGGGGSYVNSVGEPAATHQWLNAGRFVHQYATPPGHVDAGDGTDDAARINAAAASTAAFTRLV